MENKKLIHCISGPHVRKVIEEARNLEIPKEDIVTIMDFGNQVHLIYYK